MPRIARIVATGFPHHITQRGNYRQNIFVDDTDREKYLSFLEIESKRYDLSVLAYCLMPNHVHCIVIPKNEDTMGNVFKYVNMKYSQYYNKKLGAGGHLFQGRFFSSVMDESYLLAGVRYIERNPVRAKIARKPTEFKWSSARIHASIDSNDNLNVMNLFKYITQTPKAWKEYIEEPDNHKELKDIREGTRRGRPIGDSGFVEKLEKKINRFLKLKPKGRPRKDRNK